MAAADIIVTKRPATIESDTTVRKITLSNIDRGTISSKSGDRIFVGFDKAPVTTELQDDGTVFLDPGDSVGIPKGTKVLQHRAKTTIGILFFNPSFGIT